MIDLKNTEKEAKKLTACCDGQSPEYPWGLSITLENGSLEKLGLDIRRFKVGQKLKISAMAEIIGIDQNQSQDTTRSTMRLQITSMSKPAVKDRGKAGEELLNGMRNK